MNPIPLILSTSLVLGACSIRAADPARQVAEQTLPAIKSIEAERWAGYQGDPALFDPETVLLARFERDVTGDGVPDHFIGSTLNSEISIAWSVFDGSRPDSPALGTNIHLDPRSLYSRVEDGNVVLSQISRFSEGVYGLRSYSFSPEGRVTDLSKPLSQAEMDKIRDSISLGETMQSDLGEREIPEPSVILLEQFVTDPNAPWRPWDRERSVYGQMNRDDTNLLKTIRDETYQPSLDDQNTQLARKSEPASAPDLTQISTVTTLSKPHETDGTVNVAQQKWIVALLILILAGIGAYLYFKQGRNPG